MLVFSLVCRRLGFCPVLTFSSLRWLRFAVIPLRCQDSISRKPSSNTSAPSFTHPTMYATRLQASKRVALAYLSVAMTIPFLLPIRQTITQKNDVPMYGYFGVGNAFRI